MPWPSCAAWASSRCCSPGTARARPAPPLRTGVATVVAEALPADKVALVRRLQGEGQVVAVVGDGVSDARLAQADLGIAMGTGADAMIHASKLALVVRPDLHSAADAIELSRRTLGVIRANLFWALAYNCLALPLAAAGLLNPMLARRDAAFSSVFVVTNGLRLRRFPRRGRDGGDGVERVAGPAVAVRGRAGSAALVHRTTGRAARPRRHGPGDGRDVLPLGDPVPAAVGVLTFAAIAGWFAARVRGSTTRGSGRARGGRVGRDGAHVRDAARCRARRSCRRRARVTRRIRRACGRQAQEAPWRWRSRRRLLRPVWHYQDSGIRRWSAARPSTM